MFGAEPVGRDESFSIDENHGGEVVRGMHDGRSLYEVPEGPNEF